MDGPKSMRTKAAAADGIPDDPLVEILSRLPAKPLFRFKCVSTGWGHLIADRLGRKKFPQTLEGFFVGGGGAGGVNGWRFINLSGKSVPLVDASLSFLANLPGINQFNLLSAHNGLLLFGRLIFSNRYEYIVCNPATEQWLLVPEPGPGIRLQGDFEHALATEVNSLLIFDPAVSLHFHLLQFFHSNKQIRLLRTVHIYSSKTRMSRNVTTKWIDQGERRLKFAEEVRSKLGFADVNGMLHVPVYYHALASPVDRKIRIAVVNMEGKKIMAIVWPEGNEFAVAPAFIGQSQGRLYCITAHKEQDGRLVHITGLSIWALEGCDAAYNVGQWVLKQKVSCSQLFGEMGCGVDDLHVITIHPDRNLVVFVHRSSSKLMTYDMDSEEVSDLCTLGHGCGQIISYIPYFADVPVFSGRALQ